MAEESDAHKFGNHDRSRLKFLKLSSLLCAGFTSELSTVMALQFYQMNGNENKNRPLSTNPDDIEATRRKSLGRFADSTARKTSCLKCGSLLLAGKLDDDTTEQNITKYRLRPKPKTTKSVLRLLKRRNIHSQRNSNNNRSKFQQHALSHYFNTSNKLKVICSTCRNSSISLNGEKRSDTSFVNRHAVRHKKGITKRKLQQQASTAATSDSPVVLPKGSKNAAVSENHGICSTSASNAEQQSSVIHQVKQYDRCAKSFSPKHTKSPMQSFKTITNAQKDSPTSKPKIQQRVTNKNSAAIIRKFQQKHVTQLMKADQRKASSSNSSLDSFLKSMK